MRWSSFLLVLLFLLTDRTWAGSPEKQILGKWIGTEKKTAPDGTTKEVKLELEFLPSGKVKVEYPELKIKVETDYRIEKNVLVSINPLSKREQKRMMTISDSELTLRSTGVVMALKKATK